MLLSTTFVLIRVGILTVFKVHDLVKQFWWWHKASLTRHVHDLNEFTNRTSRRFVYLHYFIIHTTEYGVNSNGVNGWIWICKLEKLVAGPFVFTECGDCTFCRCSCLNMLTNKTMYSFWVSFQCLVVHINWCKHWSSLPNWSILFFFIKFTE